MQNQLQKAIELVKKTGDKIIIFDSLNSNSAYVVMSLKDYEKLVLGRSEVRGLTEDELLDKINRDIAIWKSDQNEDNIFSEEKIKTDIEQEISSENQEKKIIKAWSIPKDIKESAEEVIEEDRQYLENVAF